MTGGGRVDLAATPIIAGGKLLREFSRLYSD